MNNGKNGQGRGHKSDQDNQRTIREGARDCGRPSRRRHLPATGHPEEWIYRGSNQRKEVEARLSREGFDRVYEMMGPLTVDVIAERRTIDAGLARAQNLQSFIRIIQDNAISFVYFEEEEHWAGVKKTYIACDRHQKPLARLEMIYYVPAEVRCCRLTKGVITMAEALPTGRQRLLSYENDEGLLQN